jgi:hypothetical protein
MEKCTLHIRSPLSFPSRYIYIKDSAFVVAQICKSIEPGPGLDAACVWFSALLYLLPYQHDWKYVAAERLVLKISISL